MLTTRDNHTLERSLYWLPRILGVLFIVFLGLFAMDVFSMTGSVMEKILGFLIHLTPSFILLTLLVLAWKREKVGGILFTMFAVLFALQFTRNFELSAFLLIIFPVFLIGVLFLTHFFLYKKEVK